MDESKLPKWAQEKIRTLERERETAIRALNEYCDSQTPSPFYISELESTGETKGPAEKIRYIQTRRMTVEWLGVRLEIHLAKNDPSRADGIELQWEDAERHGNHVAFIPTKNLQLTID